MNMIFALLLIVFLATLRVVTGARTTLNTLSTLRKPDIDNKLLRLDPESTPLIVLAKQMGTKATTDVEFSYFDKANLGETTNINFVAGYLAGETSLVVDDSTIFKAYDVIIAATSLERILIQSIDYATHTLTVTRSIGSVAVANLLDGVELMRIGSAFQEGGDYADAVSNDPTKRTGCVQIVKTALKITNTQKQTEGYTGSDYEEEKRDKALLHKLELEKLAWFADGGPAHYYTGADGRARYTQGVLAAITTNVQDAGGILTEKQFDGYLEAWGNKGSPEKTLFASARLLSIMHSWGKDRWTPATLGEKYGIPGVKNYDNPHLKLNVVNARQIFKGNIFQYYNVILDLKHIKYRPLKGRDTAWEACTTTKDVTYEQFITEAGFEVRNEEAHAVLKNVVTAG